MLPLRSALTGSFALQVRSNEPDESDELQMRAFAHGDASAFETLYDKHRNWLLRMLQGKCRAGNLPLDWADDIAQETWLVLVRSSAQYQPTAKFTTWLFRLAQQRLIDQIRKASNVAAQAIVSESDFGETGDGRSIIDEVAADLSYDPANILDRRQLCNALSVALDALPVDQREVFILTTEAGMTLPQAAQALSWPLEATKSRLRYARAKLVQALEGFRP